MGFPLQKNTGAAAISVSRNLEDQDQNQAPALGKQILTLWATSSWVQQTQSN